MKLYPLVFSFNDIIAGNGFVAHVVTEGRVLLVEEEDDVWMYGVQPGGVAGGDPVRRTAYSEFKDNYRAVLFNIAADTTTFEEFKNRTQRFFDEVNEPNAILWAEALATVRASGTTLADLPTVNGDQRTPQMTVEEVVPGKIKSNANEFSEIAEAA